MIDILGEVVSDAVVAGSFRTWVSMLLLIAALGLFGWAGILLIRHDLAEHRLPNMLTLPLALGGITLLGTTALAMPEPATTRFWGMLVGAVGYAGLMLLLHWGSRGGVGMGDVKLALGLGVYTGWLHWETVVAAGILAFMIGGITAGVLMLLRKAQRHSRIAFGPAMIIGATLPLFFS